MLSSTARVKRYLAIVGVDPFVGNGFEATGAKIFDLRLIHVPPVQGSFVIRFSTLHVLGEVVPLVSQRSDNLLRIERYTYTHTHTRFLLYEQAFEFTKFRYPVIIIINHPTISTYMLFSFSTRTNFIFN